MADAGEECLADYIHAFSADSPLLRQRLLASGRRLLGRNHKRDTYPSESYVPVAPEAPQVNAAAGTGRPPWQPLEAAIRWNRARTFDRNTSYGVLIARANILQATKPSLEPANDGLSTPGSWLAPLGSAGRLKGERPLPDRFARQALRRLDTERYLSSA